MADPIIDPATGKPVAEPPPDGNGDKDFVKIKADEWAGIKAKIDTFEKMGFNLNHPATPAPAAPSGPTFDQQISDIDRGIEALDSKIDEAVREGKPVSALMRDRDKLTSQRTRLEIKHHDIDPAFATGIDTINQLSDTVTRSQMPHLDLVKDDYEAALNSMPADQRMNPKIRQAAYNIAVGQNVTKIMEVEKEKILRQASDPPPEPGAGSRNSGGGSDTIPKPKDVLPRDTMRALSAKGQTVDDYYRTLGYAGWGDFWEKRGKEYFGEVEEE